MTAAAEAQAAPAEKKRGFSLPSAYTILFILIVIVAIATWIIPAGTLRLQRRRVAHPGHLSPRRPEPGPDPDRHADRADQRHVRHRGPPTGRSRYYNSGDLFGAIDVALFILVIGGFLGVTMQTGAIQAGIGRVVQRLRGRELRMIPILMVLFALGGTTYGMAEESLAFYLLIVTVMIAAGYDALTGAALLLLGCGIGVIGSTINPFSTGIASGFAGVEHQRRPDRPRSSSWSSGRRSASGTSCATPGRVKNDPSHSMVASEREANIAHFKSDSMNTAAAEPMTGRQKVVLVVFFLAFVAMIVGVVPWSDLGINRIATRFWWFPEMTASFLLFAIVIGVVARHEGRQASPTPSSTARATCWAWR